MVMAVHRPESCSVSTQRHIPRTSVWLAPSYERELLLLALFLASLWLFFLSSLEPLREITHQDHLRISIWVVNLPGYTHGANRPESQH